MNGGKLVIGIETDTKSFDAQIEATRAKLELLEKSADETGIPEQFRRSKDEAEALNVEIEKTRNQLISLQNQQNKLDKSDGMNFASALSGLKKFGLGLIGIRGIFSLVRKASSAWLSQDTELAKKFQGIWIALGAALAPILEKLAELLMKLIGYVNVFVKAFTGGKVDLIANANAKAIQKQASAMKELKNQTYGFDELNIQQTNESSGSSSTGLEALKNIKLDPKVSKFVEDLGKVLGKIWGYLEDIIDWCKKHLGTAGTIALGLGAIIGISAIAGGTGLLGILAILLAIYDAIILIEGVKTIFETQETIDNNTKAMEKHNEALDDAFDKYNHLNKETGVTAEEQKNMEKELKVNSQSIKEHSDSLKDLTENTKFFGITTVNTADEQAELYKESKKVSDAYEKLMGVTQLSDEAQQDYIDTLEAQKQILINVKDSAKNAGLETKAFDGHIKEIDEKIKTAKKDLQDYGNTTANPKVTITVDAKDNASSKLKGIQKIVDGLIAGMGGSVKGVGSYFGATGGVLHKSALGSILNNPGRGVYVGGNTIAGEAGKEGIIPLTDPNAMAELGETIGRYITVNLTNITKLDSKTINKTNNTISNDMNFIRNGGGA